MWLAYTSLHTYREEASFSIWLMRITVNQALVQLRARARKGRPIPVAGSAFCEEHVSEVLRASDQNLEETIYSDDVKRVVSDCMHKLPPNYRKLRRMTKTTFRVLAGAAILIASPAAADVESTIEFPTPQDHYRIYGLQTTGVELLIHEALPASMDGLPLERMLGGVEDPDATDGVTLRRCAGVVCRSRIIV